MIKGQTATITISLTDFLVSDIQKMRVTIDQSTKKIVKNDEQLSNDGMNKIYCSLSQNETLYFNKGSAKLQLKLLSKAGKVYVSRVQTILFEEAIDNEVI